jgi:hypothetical protein
VSTPHRQSRVFLVGAAILAVLGIVFGVVSVGEYRAARALRSAPLCAAARTENCRSLVPATVAAISLSDDRQFTPPERLALLGARIG